MLRVFCDFDGTVAQQDVGEYLFRTLLGAKAREIAKRYIDEEINAREWLAQECAAVETVTPQELERFIDEFAIDPQFPEFVQFCAAREIPVVVLSDGLDFYVERILKNHHLDHLPWYANHLEFVNHGKATKFVPSFPYRDEECDRCGNCKRNHLLTISGDDDVLVYVGDGISDRCPVRYADIVFAKHSLVSYCQRQNISYYRYRTFGDVQARLEALLAQKRVRQRREAAIARRDVFMRG